MVVTLVSVTIPHFTDTGQKAVSIIRGTFRGVHIHSVCACVYNGVRNSLETGRRMSSEYVPEIGQIKKTDKSESDKKYGTGWKIKKTCRNKKCRPFMKGEI